jgi:flagellar assembly FlgT-like protein
VPTSPPSSSRGLGGRRRLGRRALAALAVAILGWTAPAAAGVADQVGATFGLMLQEVVDAFPAIEGLVAAVEDGRIYLDVGQQDGLRAGQEFTVFRKGDVFHHPTSQKPLGRYEDLLGHAQVIRVQPRFAEATFIPLTGKPGVQPEDGVRITRGRIKVAVAPPLDLTAGQADLRRVPFMMALGLDQTKRFQTVDPGTVRDLLLNNRTRPEELLVRPEKTVALSRMLEVAGWLIPVLIERSGAIYLDVTWVSAVTGTPLFSRRLALTRGDAVAEQRFPWEPRAED